MIIKTRTMTVSCKGKSPYGKFTMGFVSTGREVSLPDFHILWKQAQKFREEYNSISFFDLGKLYGNRSELYDIEVTFDDT